MAEPSIAEQLKAAAHQLRLEAGRVQFQSPVCCVYNPLDYAWDAHAAYIEKYGNSRKKVVFLGMNPGPFGMAQTGIPFGEVRAVRDWLGIQAPVRTPTGQHPRRPVQGFDCPRSEISGQRLWGLFEKRFGTPRKFFARHFVVNYCPLAFLEVTGRNRTPDKLPKRECGVLFDACNTHLRAVVQSLQPEWLVGVGAFAAERARQAALDLPVRTAQILHPSPASPAANRDWAATVIRQLMELGIWT